MKPKVTIGGRTYAGRRGVEAAEDDERRDPSSARPSIPAAHAPRQFESRR